MLTVQYSTVEGPTATACKLSTLQVATVTREHCLAHKTLLYEEAPFVTNVLDVKA